MQARKRLQINMKFPAKGSKEDYFDLLYPKVHRDYMLPIFYLSEEGTITPDLATQFRSMVYGTLHLVQILSWVSCCMGAALMVFGLTLFVIDYRGCGALRCAAHSAQSPRP